jgi:hypothetical protein
VRYSILSGANFVNCEKMVKKEFRVLMNHCFLAKKITVQARPWLDKQYTDSAPAKSTVEKWFAKFKRGSGRPKEAVTDENIKNSR